MNKKIRLLLIALVTCFVSAAALAEPTGVPVKILSLRPYNGPTGGAVYVEVSQVGAPCDTQGYVIDLLWVGSREVYAAAMSALMADKFVRVEAVNTGCAGWGTKIQSITIIK